MSHLTNYLKVMRILIEDSDKVFEKQQLEHEYATAGGSTRYGMNGDLPKGMLGADIMKTATNDAIEKDTIENDGGIEI